MEPRTREDLDRIPGYRQGRSAGDGGAPSHKLSSNENPYDPLPSVRDRIAEVLGRINLYPDMAGAVLVPELARLHDVDPARIVLGAGSVEVVSQLIRATTGPGEEVLFAWRSFEAYPLLVVSAGAEPVQVPLTADLAHDLPAMLAAITERTRLVIVCNPNNPTGTTVGAAALEEFLDAVPRDVVVLVDEAYREFDTSTDRPDGVALARQRDNVVVAHTFSKAYGLAGVRVGYAIAPPVVADAMRKVAVPFGVTGLAQAAAAASLEAQGELLDRVLALVAERERVVRALTAQGWDLPPTQANFVWLPTGEATDRAVEVLERHGILARAFPGEGVRVSIGRDEANTAVLAACAEILAGVTA
ncbi:histidinol-phosphate transaminase [Cellulomonas soli]|uniref:Aromatic amino acid aminotransferase n=1 Tax=Cellulomonas soli TaxID=931535 RepID=A0A512PDI7_9CELL|nr:histidinol-phosphate transaminase [Cellulomonas soli]NYI60071.1 histidinol-phosphate aminotransferase [Cellulomonas soli]GEP69275.1 putative phenylalanine aminotransferase [Cellulomonas soli]